MENIITRLPKGGDLLLSLNQVCADNKVTRGMVQLIGAVEFATMAYYDQDKQAYETFELREHAEILSCTGNVSLKDGAPFCHMHIIFGGRRGACVGGHLMPGSSVFAAEAVILPLPGKELARGFDEPTGLPLWETW